MNPPIKTFSSVPTLKRVEILPSCTGKNGVGDGVGEGLALGDGEALGLGDEEGLGVAVGVGLGVIVGVTVGVGVGVGAVPGVILKTSPPRVVIYSSLLASSPNEVTPLRL